MDIEIARTFLAIDETGSFCRAAERLGVTQSTVSTRIKTLEEDLGRSVFVRGRGGTSLTPAGSQFKRCAETLVRVWRQTRQEIALPSQYAAMITVGGQFTLWERLLLKWIPWMRAEMPDLAVRAEVGLSDGLMRQLGEGLLDIAVMYTPQNRAGLIMEQLMEERLILVATDPDRRAPNEDGYVFVDWGPEFRISHANAFPDLETPALSVSHGPLGLQHVLENGGSGYFPIRIVRDHLKAGRLHWLADAPVFLRPVYAVYPAVQEEARFKTALEGLRHVAALEAEE